MPGRRDGTTTTLEGIDGRGSVSVSPSLSTSSAPLFSRFAVSSASERCPMVSFIMRSACTDDSEEKEDG